MRSPSRSPDSLLWEKIQKPLLLSNLNGYCRRSGFHNSRHADAARPKNSGGSQWQPPGSDTPLTNIPAPRLRLPKMTQADTLGAGLTKLIIDRRLLLFQCAGPFVRIAVRGVLGLHRFILNSTTGV